MNFWRIWYDHDVTKSHHKSLINTSTNMTTLQFCGVSRIFMFLTQYKVPEMLYSKQK
jgi:hypothetical protein